RIRALHGAQRRAVEHAVTGRLLDANAAHLAVRRDLEANLRHEPGPWRGVRPDALHGRHHALLVREELEAHHLPAATGAVAGRADRFVAGVGARKTTASSGRTFGAPLIGRRPIRVGAFGRALGFAARLASRLRLDGRFRLGRL